MSSRATLEEETAWLAIVDFLATGR